VQIHVLKAGPRKPHPHARNRKDDGDDEQDELDVPATVVRLGAQVAMPAMLPPLVRPAPPPMFLVFR